MLGLFATEMEARHHRNRDTGGGRRQLIGAAPPSPSPSPSLPPPPAPYPPHPAPPIHHRLSSSVDDSLRRLPPVPHSDYRSAMLAYQQRVNPQPSRNQPPFWPPPDRTHAFRNSEATRLPSQDPASSHARPPSLISRDCRELKDDLRSLSELDSIRRSAALSANIYLDGRLGRSATLRRDGVYESSPTEVSHYHGRQAEAMHIYPSVRDPTERLRKRLREEEIDLARDRSVRYKRFCDPGLAVLPITPDTTSRNHPLVRRVLTSDLVARQQEGREKKYNRLLPSAERRTSPYVLPSKSSKKRKALQKKIASSLTKRLEEPDKKSQKVRQGHPDTSRGKPNIIPGAENELGGVAILPVKRGENLSGSERISGVSRDEKKTDECSPNKGPSRLYESTPVPSRIIKTSPQITSVKSRLVRSVGSDAKVCRDSCDDIQDVPEIALGVQDRKLTGPRELRNDLIISNMAHETISSEKDITEQDVRKDLQAKQPLPFRIDPLQARTLESTPRRNQTLEVEYHDENAVQPLASQVAALNEAQCTKVSETPLHVINEALSPSLPFDFNSAPASEIRGLSTLVDTRSTTDVEISQMLAPQLEEPRLPMQGSLVDITLESSEINTKEVKEFFPVILNPASPADSEWSNKSVLRCTEYNLYPSCAPENASLNINDDAKSMCAISSIRTSFSSPLPYHPRDPISNLEKDYKNDSDLAVSSMYKNNKRLQDVEVIEVNREDAMRETTTKREEEREVRLFGKSLKASVVNVVTEKAEISKVAKKPGSPQRDGESDSPSEEISNSPLDTGSTLITNSQQLEISFSEAGVAAGTTVENVSDVLFPLLDRDDGTKIPETNISVFETKATLPAADSNCEHDGGLNGHHADVASQVMAKSARSEINVTADMETVIACPSNGEMKSSNEGREVTLSVCPDIEQNVSSLKLNHVQSEKVNTEQSNKTTESAAYATCDFNGHELLSDVSQKEGNKVVETSSEMNLPEKSVSLPTLKQSAGSMQSYGRGQNITNRSGARTWHRSLNVIRSAASQSVSKIPKPTVSSTFSTGTQRITEVAAAYVRKGNSLVRTSAAPAAPAAPVAVGPSIGPVKDAATKVLSNIVRAPRTYSAIRNMMNNAKPTFRQVFTTTKIIPNDGNLKSTGIEKILPVPTSDVSRDSQGAGPPRPSAKSTPLASEDDINFLISTKGSVADDQRAKIAASEANNSFAISTLQHKLGPFNIQSVAETNKNEMPASDTSKNKANPLLASMPLTSSVFAEKVKITTVPSTSTRDVYYKRKNNQLVRNDTGTKKKVLQDHSSRRQMHATWNSTLRKALKKRVYLPSSSVWIRKAGHVQQVNSVLPLLFPWKRQRLGLTVRAGRFKSIPNAKKGSLLSLISKRLQRLRKVQPVYRRSAGGFSLHRSAMLSLTGANLKWTKSIEKRSKQASEEATKAVAAVEKQKRKEKEAKAVNLKAKVEKRTTRRTPNGRERIVVVGLVRYKMDPSGRTLQRLPGDSSEISYLQHSTDSTILPTPRRVSYDGTEYVRIGNGNQLVRDPKAVSRALANEKVRWSLHSARSRLAKKQQYCLFFTRFGKCNKSEGECPYIHDPEKVAVCTKFLKGTCSGANCLFSHKVVPERMPDCSFFLEGMCTNEECPYRHVYVNPKAPVCEGFLKGFCVDGDECNKKHTTICPDFAANGECQNKATCKLHHPKKKGKRAASKTIAKKSKKRRYFLAGNGLQQLKNVSDNQERDNEHDNLYSETFDFIKVPELALDVDEMTESERKFASIKDQLPFLQDCSQKDMDLWIKPILLLEKTIPV